MQEEKTHWNVFRSVCRREGDFTMFTLGAKGNLQPQCHMEHKMPVFSIRRSLPRLDCDGPAQTAEKPDAKGILKHWFVAFVFFLIKIKMLVVSYILRYLERKESCLIGLLQRRSCLPGEWDHNQLLHTKQEVRESGNSFSLPSTKLKQHLWQTYVYQENQEDGGGYMTHRLHVTGIFTYIHLP